MKMKKMICVFLSFLFIPLAFASEPLPFSPAVKAGNMLYLSGQIGIAPGTSSVVPGGVIPETHQAMKNIKQVLENHGSSLDRVVKCTVMMTDINELPQINQVYTAYFPNRQYPARSAFSAKALALNAHVEIECLATDSA